MGAGSSGWQQLSYLMDHHLRPQRSDPEAEIFSDLIHLGAK